MSTIISAIVLLRVHGVTLMMGHILLFLMVDILRFIFKLNVKMRKILIFFSVFGITVPSAALGQFAKSTKIYGVQFSPAWSYTGATSEKIGFGVYYEYRTSEYFGLGSLIQYSYKKTRSEDGTYTHEGLLFAGEGIYFLKRALGAKSKVFDPYFKLIVGFRAVKTQWRQNPNIPFKVESPYPPLGEGFVTDYCLGMRVYLQKHFSVKSEVSFFHPFMFGVEYKLDGKQIESH